MKVIAFGHRKRVGKDLSCSISLKYLEEKGLKVEVASFADVLYEICHQLYSWDGFLTKHEYDTSHQHLKETPLPTIGKSPRQILIDFGTTGVRDNVYGETWVDYLLKIDRPGVDVLLIPDLRFPNEFNTIRDMGGVNVLINRPSISNTSDKADDALGNSDWSWDYYLNNDSSIDELVENVINLLDKVLNET